MANESTPLIQTVRVGPRTRKYPHSTWHRFFIIASASILITGFTSFMIHATFIWPYEYRHGHRSRYAGSIANGLPHDELESIILDTPSSDKAAEWLEYYTSGPHLAGKNLSQAEWTRDRWQEWGIASDIVAYDSYLNYPLDHSLTLLSKNKRKSSNAGDWDVVFEASLEEDIIEEDPTSGLVDRIPTFHGYSATGNATASFVYVNYGTFQDFQDLIDAGIDLRGKIAIAKYGGIFRGLKVKRAEDLGMVGALIYSDPGDDGDITVENGYDYYPNGPARRPNSVQRGSVQYLSIHPGDPTTPGYPSKPGVPRAPVDGAIPRIPSIPISYTDALPILKALNGHGPKATDFNKYWNRNNGLGYLGVEYHVGPSPDDVVLNLNSQQDYTITPMWDVIGIVNGTIPDEVVVVGNHRDAWIAGGAADPNSGSAALNEVIRSVGTAIDAGWKPLRTIVFASWDGEEYGLVGSTEWVEEYLPWIKNANVAYVNLDVAVSGPNFAAGATPTLHQVFRDVLFKVPSPNQTVEGQTVGDLWDGTISPLGSGSDFTAFQDYAGVPCMNLGFNGGGKDAVYHYHSNYDSFTWMSKYGDPGFKYHKAMAQAMGLVITTLVDSIVIPFQAADYAEALDTYLDKIETKLDAATREHDDDGESESEQDVFLVRGQVTPGAVTGSPDALRESLSAIRRAIAAFRIKALETDELAAWVNEELENGIPWWNLVKKYQLAKAVLSLNNKYKYLERGFLFEGGLDSRSWFKHVVYAPGLWTGYSGAVYPGLTESIDSNDYRRGLKWAGIIEVAINKVAASLG
ncbi:hypothetical protein GMORB2_4025 [Geosmithia morbida]|uniref:Glutamate carboxypeptidase II n=1 Tax=Geosmithia morbida TaxID=1094350 RepID=A0A9P4Z0I6_9HYPO|nr:uncharacterized protein GMORB2_4025 [Geosmithia morbida]KAF4125186.1 hypothetical protein GMORB2_4025 [Geosmithia morbida]